MKWTIFRVLIYIIIGIGIYFWSQKYITNELNLALQQTIPQTLFVDQNSSETIETGSFYYPFHTIQTALENRKNEDANKLTTIIISTGDYKEALTLPPHTTLFAENQKVNINNPNKILGNTITSAEDVNLINLNINYGRFGVYIPYNTNINFINTTVNQAAKFGVRTEGNKTKQSVNAKEINIVNKSTEELEELPLIRFSHSTIQNSASQGLYAKDVHIEIMNSKIINNKEEGVDLHPHIYAIITDNEIIKNGESGIESEIEDNLVIIKNNNLSDNLKNGIGLLTPRDNDKVMTEKNAGKITIENNIIHNNQRYGVRCAIHKNPPTKPRPFFPTTVKYQDNDFSNNKEGDFAKACFDY
jgi:hypothetical protein